MTEEIIVDGVNVAGCQEYSSSRCWDENLPYITDCKNIPDCKYKQLQKLKQENEYLRKAIEFCIYKVNISVNTEEAYHKMKKALEEIRKIASPHCSQCIEILDKID